MNTSTQTQNQVEAQGCGGASCTCGGNAAAAAPQVQETAITSLQRPRSASSKFVEDTGRPGTSLPGEFAAPEGTPQPHAGIVIPRINGVALQTPEETPDPEQLRERAYAELLRQECVGRGLLPAARVDKAPELSEHEHQVIENLLDQVVSSPQPTPGECRRYFDAQSSRFVQGQAIRARHILFAVTPGVDVQALARRAEEALFELKNPAVASGRFAQMAGELSNCPSSVQGGDLGWIEPQECAPELSKLFFHQEQGMMPLGMQPRLVHSRFGLHIVEVLEHRAGAVPDFEMVQERIAAQLQLQSRARALHQYILLLAGRSKVEGIELEAASSPLVQ